LAGYIGNTDFDWFTFLRARSPLDEVNFWQPSGGRGFHVAGPGEPFFFRLKSPRNAIAGFGFFVRQSILPADLAWDAFGEKNGASSFTEMRRRIERYRGSPADPTGRYQVGCLIIAHPVFFDDGDWVEQPAGWAPNIVQGKGLDLESVDGRRIWEACQERMLLRDERSAPLIDDVQQAKYGNPTVIQHRLGQGAFRVSLLDAYGRACAVTREHSLPVLEAAHVKPYAGDGNHSLDNGLLLRSDLHRLFDKGYVTVTEAGRFEVSKRLKQDFDNGKVYYELHGREIHVPARVEERPTKQNLLWHNENVFLG
jgi:putative restriction endonuclease